MCLNVTTIVTIYHTIYKKASVFRDKKEHFACDNRLLFCYTLKYLLFLKYGKAIDLYAYIGLTAKGVQELSAKFEAQEEKIKTLETRIETLEALIAKLSQ